MPVPTVAAVRKQVDNAIQQLQQLSISLSPQERPTPSYRTVLVTPCAPNRPSVIANTVPGRTMESVTPMNLDGNTDGGAPGAAERTGPGGQTANGPSEPQTEERPPLPDGPALADENAGSSNTLSLTWLKQNLSVAYDILVANNAVHLWREIQSLFETNHPEFTDAAWLNDVQRGHAALLDAIIKATEEWNKYQDTPYGQALARAQKLLGKAVSNSQTEIPIPVPSTVPAVPTVATFTKRVAPTKPERFTGKVKDALCVHDWLSSMETYLWMIGEENTVLAASLNLGESAATWWNTHGKYLHDIMNWEVFKSALLDRFTSASGSHQARQRIASATQLPKQTVDEFMEYMDRQKAQVTMGAPITTSEMATNFLRGLSPGILFYLSPMLNPTIMADITLLLPAARQAEISLNTFGNPLGKSAYGAHGKHTNYDKHAQGKTGKSLARSGDKRLRLSDTVPSGPAERTDGSKPPSYGWPSYRARTAHFDEWKEAKDPERCTMCGAAGHDSFTCMHPEVKTVSSDQTLLSVVTPDVVLPSTPVPVAAYSSDPPTVELPAAPPSLFAVQTEALKMLFTGTVTEQENQRIGQGQALVQEVQKVQGLTAEDGLTADVGNELVVAGNGDGLQCQVLIDTGAGANFVSLSVLEHFGLVPAVEKSPPVVNLVNKKTAMPLGTVQLQLQLGSYCEVLTFIVLRTLNDKFQLILGAPWCKHHRVDLMHSKDMCVIHEGSETHEIPCADAHEYADADIPFVNCQLMTPLQFKRSLKTSDFVCMVLLDPTSTVDRKDDPELDALLQQFADVLVTELPSGLPPIRHTFHTIPLKQDSVPPAKNMYRMSKLQYDEMRRQVNLLQSKGLIQPSSSPYGAPVLFAPKPDGSWRMCIDYRMLNKQTVRNRYPLPRIDDLLDKLSGMKYFTSLDLAQAYHQVRLHPDDVPKTAFCTPDGLFEFKVLCFGLTNAPATFQRVINEVFGPDLGKFILAYLDDLLVFSKTREEHLTHLRIVLSKLREHKLYCNVKKCQFLAQSVQFLGHVVSADGIKPSPAKTDAVTKWQSPTTVHELQSFLGLVNYFRKFIQGYSVLTRPLTDLLRKDVPFVWSQACENAFQLLKHKLTTAPCLAIPNPDEPFELVCDACKYGTGAVLLQNGRPICFEGRKFTERETQLDAGEQELLALIYGLTKFRCYVEGVDFTLVTDHRPNTYFETQTTLSPKKVRWLDFLSRFSGMQWQYRPGRVNVADPLSRAKHLPAVEMDDPSVIPLMTAVTAVPLYDSALWEKGYAQDPWFADSANLSNLTFSEGRWLTRANQIVVPDYADMRDIIIKECHDAPFSAHPGIPRTVRNITVNYWWPKLLSQVNKYVRYCPSCQAMKASTEKQAGLLRAVQAPKSRWDIVSMDFITGLPVTANGYSAIMVVVDKLTKMARFIPCTENVGAQETAELYCKYVFKDHGFPLQIITDRGPQFTGSFFKALCTLLGTTQCLSSAAHPQTDGQTERMNRVLEEALRHYVAADQADWDKYLHFCEFAVNNAWNESTRSTPFYLNYGRHPRLPVSPFSRVGQDLLTDPDTDTVALNSLLISGVSAVVDANLLIAHCEEKLGQLSSHDRDLYGATVHLFAATVKSVNVPAAQAFAEKLHARIKLAKQALQAARSRMKAYANASRKDKRFATSDLVLLNCRKMVFPHREGNKLQPKWIGPFKILKRVGPVAYKLELPDTMKIHPVFHVNLLRQWHADPNRPIHPSVLIIAGNEEFEVEAILKHRPKTAEGPNHHGLEYLVKWKGFGPEHNQYLPRAEMAHCKRLVTAYWAKKPTLKGSGLAAAYHRKPKLPARRSKRVTN